MTIIYLAGPMKTADDGGVGWRRDVQKIWGYPGECIDWLRENVVEGKT